MIASKGKGSIAGVGVGVGVGAAAQGVEAVAATTRVRGGVSSIPSGRAVAVAAADPIRTGNTKRPSAMGHPL